MTVLAVCVCTYQRPIGLVRFLTRFAEIQPTDILDVGGQHVRVRVVIVDNEADGPRRHNVAQFARDWPGAVDFVVEPRRGIAQARNCAVRTALDYADLVVFADDDEVPEPGWLDQLVGMHVRSGAQVVVGPVIRQFEQTPPRWVVRGRFHQSPSYVDGQQLHYAWTSNVCITREMFGIAEPPFNEALGLAGGEDTFFFRQAFLAGCRFVWAEKAEVIEYIPMSRCTVGWLLRREYRRGNTLSLCMVALEASPWRRIKRTAHAVVAVLQGLGTLLFAPLGGRTTLVKSAQRISFAAGLITGMRGQVYREYERIHGS